MHLSGDRAPIGGQGQAKTFGHRFVGDMAAVNIQTASRWGFCFTAAKPCSLSPAERQCRVVQGLARRQRNRAGHIRHAING